MPTDQQLDAMRLLLLGEPPDFAKARAVFPPSDQSLTELPQLVVVKNETMVVTGDLRVHGPLVLEMGALLWVYGQCTVEGDVYSKGLQYSLVAVGDTLEAQVVRSAGEVFALGGLKVDTLIGVYNDHSTYAPVARCKTYIAFDRTDFISELHADTKLTEPDSIEYGLGLLFPGLYPRLPDENDQAFERRERAFFTRGLSAPASMPLSAEESQQLTDQLSSSDPAVRRAAYHVIRRKHALQLALALGVVIRAAPEQSAEALEVLGALGAAEVLSGLLDGTLRFGRIGSAVARAFAEVGWQTKSENRGEWVFSVRASSSEPWREIP